MKLAPSRIRTNSDEFEACQHVWPPHRPAQPSLAFHWAALVGPTLGLLGTPTFMGGEVSSGPVGVRQCNCTYGGGEYTDPEALWEALGALNGEATRILRATWVKTQRGGRLPKRGDKLPPEALITVQELREIHAKALALPPSYGAKGGPSRPEKALPAIALSHYWRTKEHSDPDGVTLGCTPTAAPPPTSARSASLLTPAPCRDAAQARH